MATMKLTLGHLTLPVTLLILSTVAIAAEGWISHLCLNDTHLIKMGHWSSILINPQIMFTDLGFLVSVGAAVYGGFRNGTRIEPRHHNSLKSTEHNLLESARWRLEKINSDLSVLGPNDRFFSVRYKLDDSLTMVKHAVNCDLQQLVVNELDVMRLSDNDYTIQGSLTGFETFRRRTFSLEGVLLEMSSDKVYGIAMESQVDPSVIAGVFEFRNAINEASSRAETDHSRRSKVGTLTISGPLTLTHRLLVGLAESMANN